MIALPKIFLDTNVLYGEMETDVLLSLASDPRAMFRPYWSDYVENELREHVPERLRRLQKTGNIHALTEKRLAAMNRFFPEARVVADRRLLDQAKRFVRDPDDAPILAGAMIAHADSLMTVNVKDFDIAAISRFAGIRVEDPVPILDRLYQSGNEAFTWHLVDMVSHHLYPPQTLEELADMSERSYLRGLGGILEREMERQHAAVRAAHPVSGPQGRDRLGRFTAKRGDASDLPNPLHGIWGPNGNGWS